MPVLKCTIPCPQPNSIATRLVADVPGAPAQLQTLTASGQSLCALLGAEGHEGLEIGPPLQLYGAPAAGDNQASIRRPYATPHRFNSPVWDIFSASLFVLRGHAITRVVGDVVALVAGQVEEAGEADGNGAAARFNDTDLLASDGEGALYCAHADMIRKIQLPAAWRAEAGAAGGVAATAAAPEEAVVTTWPFQAGCRIQGLVYIAGNGSNGGGGSSGGALVFATHNALYRVPMGAAADFVPVLLAGRPGEVGGTDGRGRDAQFHRLAGLAVDAGGCIIAADMRFGVERTSAVRRVAPDGTVTTLAAGLAGLLARPAILPNGYLALCNWDDDNRIVVLDLGLKLPLLHRPPTAPIAGLPLRTLPADLGALLHAQLDGTSDLTIVVGDRTFAVHRAILSARCDYFRQRLIGGTFADGSAAQLSLPDTDPAAFALLLCFLYTGAADIPAELACAVAELGDRLLLPELCAAAQAQVLAAVAPATVVGSLLWAASCQARGSVFLQLLSDLKAWYVEHQEEVVRVAGDSVMRLMAEAPALTMELMIMLGSERSAKRVRR